LRDASGPRAGCLVGVVGLVGLVALVGLAGLAGLAGLVGLASALTQIYRRIPRRSSLTHGTVLGTVLKCPHHLTTS
jgi:hypothetical protein